MLPWFAETKRLEVSGLQLGLFGYDRPSSHPLSQEFARWPEDFCTSRATT
jgi:hypothetical protein